MIRISSSARRYANVLVELCTTQKSQDTCLDNLNIFNEVVEASEELQDIIRNPLVRKSEAESTVSAIATKLKLEKTTINFLSLLAHKRRLPELKAITAAFQEEIEQRRSTIVAEVDSSHKLTKAQVTKLETTLKKKTGRDVNVTVTVIPDLIGGLVIRLGSCLIDASIKTRLTKMKQLLERVPNETASS